ncbi:serine/threonine-protein kinase [Nonomuraea sp. NPDC050643]|uniref:serine/threonine-protein kinase n=1 Tax=Nonomuraea sp. NPDC050643 TaxID=3155660 RepID=UPI00340F255D
MPSITERRAGDPAGLGGYEIRGRLGEGGQGVVYLGVSQDDQVAVKWLRPHLAGDAVAAQRFAREAEVARRVAPFCTAKVLATGVHEGRPFIVSEYVEGPSLQRAVTEQGPRTAAGLHRLAIGTATALAAIHQAGIVHRDFSPGNVILGGEGPRVIDFGIARALDATSTITSMPVGTPAFMAPEQILAQPVGAAADMFAWGSTMVFAAGGAGPFEAETVPAIIHRVLHTEPDLSRLTGPLRELVAACLAKDPARRPTAQQVVLHLLQQPVSTPDALHRAATAATAAPHLAPHSTPHLAPPPGPQPPPSRSWEASGFAAPPAARQAAGPRWAPGVQPVPFGPGTPPPSKGGRKGWVLGAVIAGVALVAAVAIVVVTAVNLPLPGPRPRPSTPPSAAPATPSRVPTANLATIKLPDTEATIYESPADPIRLTTYMVRNAGSGDWVYYTRDSLTGSFKSYPDMWESMLSPDGRRLVQRGKKFAGGYDTAQIIDKVTGERFTVRTSQQPLSAYVQGWSRDSARVLFNVGNPVKGTWQSTGFAIVDVNTRKATIASLREGSLKGIRYGFDHTGTGVVALSNDTAQQALRFFDATGQRVRRLPNVGAGIADALFSPSGGRFVTNCPGLLSGTNCVYDSRTGAEVKRVASPCSGLATWYDDDHLACWVRQDGAAGRQRLQVIDFAGEAVRLLADVPRDTTGMDVLYTYIRRN